MKYLYLIFVFLIPSFTFSQTNILDSTVGWDSLANQNMLTVFLSDSTGVSSMNVRMGTQYDSSDVFVSDYVVGNTAFISNNMMMVPLTDVPSANYFISVTIVRLDASKQVIEYQTQ